MLAQKPPPPQEGRPIPSPPAPLTAEKVERIRAAVESILGVPLEPEVSLQIGIHLTDRRDLYLDLLGDGHETYFPPDKSSGEFLTGKHHAGNTTVVLFMRPTP